MQHRSPRALPGAMCNNWAYSPPHLCSHHSEHGACTAFCNRHLTHNSTICSQQVNEQIIKNAILIADLKAHTWNKRLQDLMFSTFDEVRLCSNHSKVMVMQGENYSVTTLCSQNQSRGERLENFTIIGGEDTAENVKQTLLNYPTFLCQTNS